MDPKNPLMTISELQAAECFDSGVSQALRDYFLLGLHPGSFGVACLLGDYDLAYQRAHVHLKKPHGENEEDIIRNMVSLASYLPNSVVRDYESINAWCNQGGFDRATPAQRVLLKLEWCSEIWGKFPSRWKSYE
ncbi:hypothetical protein D3C87_650980 [compost metagenome]